MQPESAYAPLPSGPQIANSILVIGCGLFISAAGLACFASGNPFAIVGALPMGLLGGLVVLLQYNATFRRSPGSAEIITIALTLGGCGLICLFAVFLPSLISAGLFSYGPFYHDFLLPLIAITSCAWISRTLNARWRDRINIYASIGIGQSEVPLLQKMVSRPWSLRDWAVAGVSVGLILCGAALFAQNQPPEWQFHVTAAEVNLGLPEGASDVNVIRQANGAIAFDFAIDEAGFWEWANEPHGSLKSMAAQREIPIKPIESGIHMTCCRGAKGAAVFDSLYITRGWHFSWREEDRGLYYAFDADTCRAYYYFHSR